MSDPKQKSNGEKRGGRSEGRKKREERQVLGLFSFADAKLSGKIDAIFFDRFGKIQTLLFTRYLSLRVVIERNGQNSFSVFHVQLYQLIQFRFNVVHLSFDFDHPRRQTDFTRVNIFCFRSLFTQYLVQPVMIERNFQYKFINYVPLTFHLPVLQISSSVKKISVSRGVLLHDVFHVVRFQRFPEFSSSYEVF